MFYYQIHTRDDLLKSVISIDDLATELHKRNVRKAAIVNESLYGVPYYVQQMKNRGIHPIIGLKATIFFDEQTECTVFLYAENERGYHQLLKISSAIEIQEERKIPLEWLSAYSEHILIILPFLDETSTSIQMKRLTENIHVTTKVAVGISYEQLIRHSIDYLEIQQQLGHDAPSVVFTQEVRVLQRAHLQALRVVQAIDEGEIWENIKVADSEVLLSEEEIENLSNQYSDLKIATEQFFDGVIPFEITTDAIKMPVYPTKDANTELEQLCMTFLKQHQLDQKKDYQARLKKELAVIQTRGFSDYFLILHDIVRFAAKERISTGPGRGSSAGSLVAYCLMITKVDPIEHDLLFERFLNKERQSIPDIDLDIADTGRQKVIEYVRKKYGQDKVAHIGTFSTLTLRAAIRAVARTYAISSDQLERWMKEISLTKSETVQELMTRSTLIQKDSQEEKVREFWAVVQLIEGSPRAISTHAAGIIVSPQPIVQSVPLQLSGDGLLMTQWPMKDVEAAGLVKMDLLSLRNLSIIDRIERLIGDHQLPKPLPFDDEQVFQLFSAGDTLGIFQFESRGMIEALQTIRPSSFADVVATNALYRPGPMAQIPVYAARKKERNAEPMQDSKGFPTLKETYGLLVYQEQMMEIMVDVTGMSYAEADVWRRKLGKATREELKELAGSFVQRAIAHGTSKENGLAAYVLLANHASYSFPKSHAVAYSMISYQLAYYKVHFPSHFFSALLSFTSHDDWGLVLEQCRKRNIPILPPSINKSYFFETVEEGAIRLGLSKIKSLPYSFVKTVIEERQSTGKFRNFEQLISRLPKKTLTRTIGEALVYSGALDDFTQDRNEGLALLEGTSKQLKFSNFGTLKKKKPVETITQLELLEKEKYYTGLYLSEHPIELQKKKSKATYTDLFVIAQSHLKNVVVLGLITSKKVIRTKKGQQMAFVVIQDETGEMSITVFPNVFQHVEELLVLHQMIEVTGHVEERNHQHQIIAKNISVVKE